MWREPQAIHTRRKTADDAIAGIPTSGGVAQGPNIKAGSSRENGKTGQRSTRLQTLKGKKASCQNRSRPVCLVIQFQGKESPDGSTGRGR